MQFSSSTSAHGHHTRPHMSNGEPYRISSHELPNDTLEQWVKHYPIASTAIAFITGFFAGAWMR